MDEEDGLNFEDEMFIHSTELFLGEYVKATKEECHERVYNLLKGQRDLFLYLNNFYLDIAEPNAPKISEIAINLIDRFDVADMNLCQNYFGLLNLIEEAYSYGVENTSFGDVNKGNSKVLRPSWLNQIMIIKSELLEAYTNNLEAITLTDSENYEYFINVKEDLPFVILKDNIFEMQSEYLHSKYEQEKIGLYKELSKRCAPTDYYA